MPSEKKILLDISTSYNFRSLRPVGILRVEHELITAFTKAYGDRLVLGVYDPAKNAYFTFPKDKVESIIFRNEQETGTLMERALTATAKWRSWVRVARFALTAPRRSRQVSGTGDQTHKLRERILADELLRMSNDEFTMLIKGLRALARLRPRLNGRCDQLEQINHRAHHGILQPLDQSLRDLDNQIDPTQIGNYICAGTFWSDTRHIYAYDMRNAHGWRTHYLIYDLIPILWRHVAEPHTRETFPASLHWVLWGVDQIWTISETTSRDLIAHIEEYGYPRPDDSWIKPIYLGCELERKDDPDGLAQNVLARHKLEPGKYVLMVGTQEARKNHEFSYRLWRELCQRHNEVLPLVWVGQPGWAIDHFLQMVSLDVGLPHDAIRILTAISDPELDMLYRNCRFTLYPSLYEGWGLPVVESLNYGKPCVCSTADSIVEAAGTSCEAIPLTQVETWLDRVWALMSDELAYTEALARAAQFKGYRWQDFRTNLIADFDRFEQAMAPRDVTPATIPAAELPSEEKAV
ncbi:glycosyltransferase [Aquimixticola soesokkakensis]|nr:glycosyltransferase [Aquimixticola soesokkakensis]